MPGSLEGRVAGGRMADGPEDSPLTVLLAHGAGAPMDTPFMNAFATGIAQGGYRVLRFEFAYMAARREGRRPGPGPEARLLQTFREVVAEHANPQRLVIGGKSMGGQLASMIADEVGIRGLVCLGYPFHPPGRAEKTRLEHLAGLRTPTLIVQGTRDAFGAAEEVAAYQLGDAIRIHWLADGDHSFKPRAGSGRTERDNWDEGVGAVVRFLAELTPR